MKRLALVLCLLCSLIASDGWAAITNGVGVATATCGSGLTQCAVTLNGMTAGRQAVIVMEWGDATETLVSVSVTGQSNATIRAGSVATNATTPYRIQQACVANIASSGNKTFTMTLTGTASDNMSIGVKEYQGGDTTNFCSGAENAANANTGTPEVSLTTTVTDSLVVVGAFSTSAEPAPATGYTLWVADWPDAGWFEEVWDDLNVGGTGAKTITATGGGSEWAMSAAEYTPAGGGGGGGALPKMLMLGVGLLAIGTRRKWFLCLIVSLIPSVVSAQELIIAQTSQPRLEWSYQPASATCLTPTPSATVRSRPSTTSTAYTTVATIPIPNPLPALATYTLPATANNLYYTIQTACGISNEVQYVATTPPPTGPTLEERVATLEGKVAVLQLAVASLQSKDVNQETSIRDLQSEISAHTSAITALQSADAALRAVDSALQSVDTDQSARMTAIQNAVANVDTRLTIVESGSQPPAPSTNLSVKTLSVDQVEITGLNCASLKTTGTGLKRIVTCVH